MIFVNKSLSFRLSLIILSSLVVLFFVMFPYYYIVTKNYMYKDLKEDAVNIAQVNISRISSQTESVQKILQSYTAYLQTQQLDSNNLANFLRESVIINKDIFGSTIALEPFSISSTIKEYAPYYSRKGGGITYTDLSSKQYNYMNWEWYKSPKESGYAIWSEPYFDKGGGDVMMTTYSNPLYHFSNGNKRFLGVSTVDLPLDWTERSIDSIKIYESGYAFLISPGGRLIAHKYIDKDYSNKDILASSVDSLQELRSTIQSMVASNEGFINYHCQFTNQDGLLYFKKLESTNWRLALFFPENEYMATFNNMNIVIFLIGLTEFIILLIFIGLVSRNITKPLDNIALANESIANGNLREADSIVNKLLDNRYKGFKKLLSKATMGNMNFKNQKNEVIRMIMANRKMLQNLSNLIGKVQKSSADINSAVSQINYSARELETTATEQSSSTREVAATTNAIAKSAKELNNAMLEAADKIGNTVESAQTGNDKLNELSGLMNDFNKSTQAFSMNLSMIADKANRVSAIVTTITKISEQTNLLSLNAAIEAERAGEYGKGFAIVAYEINRLADQTQDASEDIEFMIKEMQNTVSNGVVKMDKFTRDVFSSVNQVRQISEYFQSILEQVEDIKPIFEHVSTEVYSQTNAAQQISEAMSQLEITVDQTKNALMDFKDVTKVLSTSIQELINEVNYFKTN